MTQADKTTRLSELKVEVQRVLEPLKDAALEELDADDRARIARRYGKRLQNLYQELEHDWVRLLIVEREANSNNRQRPPDQRSSREFELFARALALLPLARDLRIAQQQLSSQPEVQGIATGTRTISDGLQALQAGKLKEALALFADISETDISGNIQYQRELEAEKLLQTARREHDKLAQLVEKQDQQQAHQQIQDECIEPVIRIGREVQREAARRLLPAQSGLAKIVAPLKSIISTRTRLIPVALVVLVLLCGTGIWLVQAVSGTLVATNLAPTPSVTEDTITPGEPSVLPATTMTASAMDPSRPTSTFAPSMSAIPATEPSLTATSEPPTPTVTATLSPTTEIPVAETRTPSPNVITIALQSPQSGEWAGIGIGIRRGAELAILQQNPPLADLGFRVEFAPFDDAGNSEQGITNAQQIVADPDVLCMVGHFNSGVTRDTYEAVYAASDLVVISPGATNPRVTDETERVWRVVGRDDVQGVVAAQFAREELGSQRAYVIHDSTAYGRGIASFFRDEARVNGPEVLTFTFFKDTPEKVDFTSFLDDIQEQEPDLIFFAGSYTHAGEFFNQARERGITAQFLGSDSVDNPGLVTVAGAEVVDGMHFTTVAAPVSAFPNARQFAQDYVERYGEPAPAFSPEAYDATTLCIQAIARAAQANGGVKPSRQQVFEAMKPFEQRETRFRGISGSYWFNTNGDPVSVAYFVVEVNAANWSENRVVKQLFCGEEQCSEVAP